MKLQLRVTEPVTELVDLSLIPVIKMLPGTKDFDGFEAGVPHALKPDRRQAVADEEVGRQYELHLNCSLEIDDGGDPGDGLISSQKLCRASAIRCRLPACRCEPQWLRRARRNRLARLCT